MKHHFRIVMAGLILCAAGLSCTRTTPEVTMTECDRDCLRSLVDQYLEAMVAGDPSGLPLASNVRYTEDTAEIPLGDGLWVGASAMPTAFRIYALDPESGQAGFFGIMQEWDNPILLALRLKVANGEITEIEHVIARKLNAEGLQNLIQPPPAFLTPVPVDQRDSRADMVRIAGLYFDAIEQDEGDVAPFADDCIRFENGMQFIRKPAPDPAEFGTSPAERERYARELISTCSCREQINTGILTYITRIRPRRLTIIDEELGLVFAFPTFVHRGDIRTIQIKNIPGVDTITQAYGAINLQAGEIFKIYGGQIHEIEANGVLIPYGLESGWEGE